MFSFSLEVFWREDEFNFNEVQLINFSFIDHNVLSSDKPKLYEWTEVETINLSWIDQKFFKKAGGTTIKIWAVYVLKSNQRHKK